MQEYKYIVWVGGVDVYLGNIYKRAKECYDNWVDQGYDDVILEVTGDNVHEVWDSFNCGIVSVSYDISYKFLLIVYKLCGIIFYSIHGKWIVYSNNFILSTNNY